VPAVKFRKFRGCRMHPPDTETNRAALADGPVRINSDFSIQPNQLTSTVRQAQHIRRLYLISFDAARIVAELAFGVAR
jgi:hypothetical protein